MDWLLKRGYSLTVARGNCLLSAVCCLLRTVIAKSLQNLRSLRRGVRPFAKVAIWQPGLKVLAAHTFPPKEVLGTPAAYLLCASWQYRYAASHRRVILPILVVRLFAIFYAVGSMGHTWLVSFHSVLSSPAGSHHADIIRSLIVHIANSSLPLFRLHSTGTAFLVVPRN